MKIAKEIDRPCSTLIGRHVDGFKGYRSERKTAEGTNGMTMCNAMQRNTTQRNAIRCAAIKVVNDDDEERVESRGKSTGRATKCVCVCVCVCVYGPLQKEARGADRVLTDNGLLL
jgi:hypothetical protein